MNRSEHGGDGDSKDVNNIRNDSFKIFIWVIAWLAISLTVRVGGDREGEGVCRVGGIKESILAKILF